jgi:hypothetical protein
MRGNILWILSEDCILLTNTDMKSLLLTIIFSLTSITFSLAKGKESIPYYYVTKDERDPKLSATESEISFAFSAYGSGSGLSNHNQLSKEVRYAYNGVNAIIKPDGLTKTRLKLKPGKYVFQFFYSSEYFEIKTDSILLKPGHAVQLSINFHSSLYPVICDKPVIYLYPEKTTEVKVKLELKGDLLFTYPAYNNEWKVTANPDGKISIGEKRYDYLFWEGSTNLESYSVNLKEGFVVEKKDLITFFEEKLSEMGLNESEKQDFITYWCPLMQANEKNYVHFLFNEEFGKYAPLTIEPKPDHLFRVFMVWSKAEGENSNPVPQKILSVKREGFSVIEWGGTKLVRSPKVRSTESDVEP